MFELLPLMLRALIVLILCVRFRVIPLAVYNALKNRYDVKRTIKEKTTSSKITASRL
jgi:hypothetical protein